MNAVLPVGAAAGEERFLRNRILVARQLAEARGKLTTSATARCLYRMIYSAAGSYVSASADRDELAEVRATLVRMFLVASFFDARESS